MGEGPQPSPAKKFTQCYKSHPGASLSSLCAPPLCVKFSSSWLHNPACSKIPSQVSSSKPLLPASPSATPGPILTIPPSPPPAPATRRDLSARKKSPITSASTSAPPPSTAAITPCHNTPPLTST